ncbi:MAG: glycoside hydrolase, partial [Chloroflexota bacterium]|nr:glycoside hydrolase [Chloroflexota bacterium]
MKRFIALIAAGLCLAGAGAAGVAAQPQPTGSKPPVTIPQSAFRNPQSSAPAVNPVFLPNHRANTDSTTYAQQEPSIAVNPTNPLNIIASGKDERSAPGPGTATKQVWEYTSTDGGVSWINQAAPLNGPNSTRQSDPVNIFSDTGVAYACYLGYNDGGGFADTGIYVTRSTDGGLTWNNTVVAVAEGGSYSTDKQWLAIDNTPTSPFYHRIYLSWTEFGVCSGCIHFVYSTDGGLTWSSQAFQLSTTNSNQQFSMPTVLANGNVFVNWANGGSIAARTSTDGGVTFSPQVTVGTMNTNLAMPGRNWRISAIPVAAADRSTPGRIAIIWNDGRNNAASGVDIYSIRSTDGGTTWTAPARVNDDPTGMVRQQAEPWVTSSPNGLFHAIWYDEREDSSANIVFNIYYAQSSDGGATWSANIKASDATTDLNIGIPTGSGWNGAAGDYINLAATDTDIYGVWTDTRSGTNEDIYSLHGVFGGSTPTATTTSQPTTTATATSQPTASATLPPSVTRTATVQPSATATSTGVAATATATTTAGLP